ncbi:hypothetical protein PDG61_20705 [Mycolicibacterium sp. BiH015]|uniref:hypothetical protein n=1 Tax=Mycolicibacterium sp. BiH015 TaxID=3018808 RepID=UPI0022E7581F|nr:hypothetical protein [Mycolicibacterium sp. BiH015]MDA2893347.1 hypothetical protein [Mycolicibacterium sp. BiH015]
MTALMLTARIGDHTHTLAEIQRWEAHRALRVLARLRRRLGHRAVVELLPDVDGVALTGADLTSQRAAIRAIKTGLGHAGIYALLQRDIAITERAARLAVTASRGKTAHSTTHLTAPGYSANAFVQWFDNLTAENNEAAMVEASPDHYLLRGLPDGRQEVVETTGGSPLATRFIVDYDHPDPGTVPADPRYPHQIVGRAVLDDGHIVGGVRHQFRNEGDTLHAHLTVEFPATFPQSIINAHRWHLASEFSNWITASAHPDRYDSQEKAPGR